MTPQLTAGARRPNPRKLSAVSPRIIAGIDRVALAIRCDMKFGNRCLRITRAGDAPIISAALTYSSSRRLRNFDRTARARPGQSRIPRMIEMIKNTDTGP